MNKNSRVPGNLIALVSNSTWAIYNFRLDIIRFLRDHQFQVLVIAPPDDFAPLLEAEGCSYRPIQFNNRSENPLRGAERLRSGRTARRRDSSGRRPA